jgi:fructose transport system ATP-binding protein
MREPILTARGLTKRYGRVIALDGADFDVAAGEIVGVIGDNGAGKTTLIKALAGALRADRGEIRLEGRAVQFDSPRQARAAGIEAVHQTLALSPALSIVDNLFMGRELRASGLRGRWLRKLDHAAMERAALDKLDELKLLTIRDVRRPIETLSGGQRQGVAIARAVAFGSKILILDEPTAALGVAESRRVLDLLLAVRERAVAIVLVSHNIPHVFEVADRIHVHRHGRRLAVLGRNEHTMSDAVALMTGAVEPAELGGRARAP